MTKASLPAHRPGPSAELAERYRALGWWSGEPLSERFRALVGAAPDRPALIDDRGATFTRQQLWDEAARFAAELKQAGVQHGDAVLCYLPNIAAWQTTFLGCLQMGAVPATLPTTTDATTLAHVCELIGARAFVAMGGSRSATSTDRARAVAVSSGREMSVVTIADDGSRAIEQIDGTTTDPVVPQGIDHLMFTSSTTGMPKAVMHTSDTLASVNRAFAERFALSEDTPIFMPSPLGHSVGAWHGGRLSLYLGATLVLQESWDPARGLELIDEHHCVFTAAATPFLKDVVDVPWPVERPKMASLKTFLCGGAPVPPSLLEAATVQAPETFVTVLWGMTEGAGTTCVPESTLEQLTGSAGKPLPDLELSILNPGANGSGELAIRGPQVFVGYLGQDELYEGLLTEDGFFRTGDLATIDDEGYLHLTGRLKDLIIRGGVNISPVPIENAIAAHPAIRRVAVLGQPDERLGERICAVIVPSAEAPTLEELNVWLTAQGVATRNLPESLFVVEDMPVTAAGKIRKVDLRSLVEDK